MEYNQSRTESQAIIYPGSMVSLFLVMKFPEIHSLING